MKINMSNSTPQLPFGPKKGKGKKSKSSVYFAPVNLKVRAEGETISNIEMIIKEITGEFKCLINDFLNSSSTDDQIPITKKLIDVLKNEVQENVVNFIVIVLFESEPRHPVKCLLMRHLDRWSDIHEIFTKLLASHIMSYCNSNKEYNYERNNHIVSRLGSCLENFPLGFQAVQLIENYVLQWLIHSLIGSLEKLKTQVSPEDKLSITKLMHQTTRLLLQMYQKASINMNINLSIKNVMVKLLDCSEVSVDTKCLCAMLDAAVLKREGRHPWDKFGECTDILSNEKLWSTNDTNLLCFYFALFSTAPSNVIDLLDYHYSVEAKKMFYEIVKKLVDITEGMSETVDATMAGARTVAIITSRLAAVGEITSNNTKTDNPESNETESKKLRLDNELNDSESYLLGFNEFNEQGANDMEIHEHRSNFLVSGNELIPQECKEKLGREASLRVALLVERCLTSLGAHVAAAPRQVAAQAQVDLLDYYLQHHPEEGRRWVCGGGVGPEGLRRLQCGAAAARRRGAGAGPAPARLLPALAHTHTMLQASSLLSTYIRLDCESLSAELVHSRWVEPTMSMLVSQRDLNHDTLDHLIALLATAVDLCDGLLLDYILPLIQKPEATHPATIKCTLLLMHVVLKSKAGKKYQDTEEKWKGIIAYDVLEQAILHDDDQVVSMSLFAGLRGALRGGLAALRWLMQAHAHRALATHTRTLDRIQQFLKRVETEYRTAKRKDANIEGDKVENHIELLSGLRSLCFDNLLPGGNHHRRGISLFVLKHVHSLRIDYQWPWTQNQVDTILRHIDDTYDTNRHTAFNILLICPLNLLKDSMESCGMTSIQQIVSTCGPRARDASGAALRVELLLFIEGTKPSEQVTGGSLDGQQEMENTETAYRKLEAASDHTLAGHSIQTELEPPTTEPQDKQENTYTLTRQIVAEQCLELAQTGQGRASALHILQAQLKHLPPSSSIWSLAEELAMKVLDLAAPLVEAASPEGYVPDMFFDMPVHPHPESEYLFMVGEEVMTAQTMLLYAWTSAKEAWSILSAVGVRGAGPGAGCVLASGLCARLLRVRHRALLDYAAASLSTLLQHYHSKANGNTTETEEINRMFDRIDGMIDEEIVSCGDGTRRGAGLTALALARAAGAAPVCRRLAARLARAIRGKASTAPHIAAALLRDKRLHRHLHHDLQHLMLAAFEQLDDTNTEMQWSCASVISAGVRRALGPSGPGGTTGPSLRQTVFVSRYPLLYKRITEIISKACDVKYRTRASLASALVVLGRVQGEGGAAAGALGAGLRGAAASPAHLVRALAARAAAAAAPHNKYLKHTNEVLSEISDRTIEKNLCHGLILRLIAMIESAPELEWSEVYISKLSETLWILETSCFPLMHEYINLILLLHDKYPAALTPADRAAVGAACGAIARGAAAGAAPGAGAGRAACGGAAAGAACALLPHAGFDDDFSTYTYEVCLAILKHHLSTPTSKIDPSQLCTVYTSHPHPECRRHALHVLVERGLIGHVLETPPSNLTESDKHNWKILNLYEKWENAVENERGLFIQGLSHILTVARESAKGESSENVNTEADEVTIERNAEADEVTMEKNAEADEESLEKNAEADEDSFGKRAGKAVASMMFASSALNAAQHERDAAEDLVQEHADWLLGVCDNDDDLKYCKTLSAKLEEFVEISVQTGLHLWHNNNARYKESNVLPMLFLKSEPISVNMWGGLVLKVPGS